MSTDVLPTTDVIQQWLASPIIAHVLEQNPDLTIREVLILAHQLMVELEDRFPVHDFGLIFAGCSEALDHDEVVVRMRAAGVSPENIALLGLSPARSSTLFSGYERRAQLADTGLSRAELQALGNSRTTSQYAVAMRKQELTEEQQAAAERVLDNGEALKAVAADLGVDGGSLTHYCLTVRWRRERQAGKRPS